MSLANSKKTLIPFIAYVDENIIALRSYCRSLAKTTWDADDLVQETLLKAFKSWKNNPRLLSKAFFIRIASNTWIDQYRKKTLPIEDGRDINQLTAGSPHAHTEHDRKLLLQMLKVLSPKQRAAVLLMEGFGLSAKEAAKALNLTEGAVKANLHRGRKKLEEWRDERIKETDEEQWMPYIDALSEGGPENIVHLYQAEIGKVHSDAYAGILSHARFMTNNEMPYVLLTIVTKNGGWLTIPFYQKELQVLLAWLQDCFTESYALIA